MTWQPIAYVDAENLDGVWWHAAPKPRRWHRCKPQTRGRLDGRTIERCACGAVRIDGHQWFERNSRTRP